MKILILLLLPLMAFSQDVDSAYKMYSEGTITKSQFIEMISDEPKADDVYEKKAREYFGTLDENEVMLFVPPGASMDVMDGLVGTVIGFLGKALKWAAERDMLAFLGPMFNCQDINKKYEEIGRYVVASQLNPFLESIGAPLIEDQ